MKYRVTAGNRNTVGLGRVAKGDDTTMSMDIAIIVDGGLVRDVYVNGQTVDFALYDFDVFDGGDTTQVSELLEEVDAIGPGELKENLLSRIPRSR